MIYQVVGTVRAAGLARGPWLSVTTTVEAPTLSQARRRWINTVVLAGLEYGTLHIT